ncbi:DUF4304 domain-containing protein [Pseudorivibacter rhizosphaerae]|uniref:DUF4304 domain-containing protein n=1 Tax=Methylibium rhizosphaerae TaxID=2570323 RepID=UPI0015E46B20
MARGDLKAPTLLALRELLRPLGYRKSSSLFSRPLQDVVHLIEVQGSRQSTAAEAKFTVNVGAFAPALIYADVRATTKPSIPLAHWRERLGFLSPENEDTWWKVRTAQQAEAVAVDIATRIERFALPALGQLQQLDALVTLWKAGQSPGLTEHQRREFLVRLGHVPSSAASAA